MCGRGTRLVCSLRVGRDGNQDSREWCQNLVAGLLPPFLVVLIRRASSLQAWESTRALSLSFIFMQTVNVGPSDASDGPKPEIARTAALKPDASCSKDFQAAHSVETFWNDGHWPHGVREQASRRLPPPCLDSSLPPCR